MKLVIVGGVAGGASAAARGRRLSEEAEIILFERGPDVSFANCGLPYHIGDKIVDRSKLLVVTPQRMRERYNLDVRVRSNVESIDRDAKTVTVRNLETDEVYEQPYDKLILAPGAAPLKPPIPGIDTPGIYTLRNLDDMDRIKAAVRDGVKRAVVVGAGFIGLELVENFVHLGIETTLIELQDQVLPPLDIEMTTPLLQCLNKQGVAVYLQEAACGFEKTETGIKIELKSGKTVEADMVSLGIGVRPENQLATDAGLECGPRGGIVVNEHMLTSDPDIYAVGDAVQVRDFILDQDTQVPLAGPANRQGRIAANHIFGRDSNFRGVQGTAVLGMFGMTAACTGSSEKMLQRFERPYRATYIHPANHAGYYPGAEGMVLKLLFDPESGKILGAQGVGGAGVDKRIDVLATAIQASFSVYDLEESELAYAPQFGSAKDPVNMLGFVASGILRDDHPQVDVRVVLESEDQFVVDVRTEQEFAAGHVPGAVNIPVDELRGRLDELPREKPIVAYCQVGMRGYLATRILLQSGFDVKNMSGGFKTYKLWCPED